MPVAATSPLLGFVYLMWFIVLCDPQWFIAAHSSEIVLKVPTVLFGLLLLLTLLQGPRNWFLPMLAFTGYTLVTLPFAYDRAAGIGVAKALIAYYVLALASLTMVRRVGRVVPIVTATMMLSYVWWVGFGAKSGGVSWHPALRNYDGFGPLMVIGMGSCYYFGMATSNRWLRRLAFAAAGGCAVGLVSSYARGAFLSGAAVIAWIWMRDRRKLVGVIAVAVAALAIVVSAALFKGSSRGDANPDFWTEMSTIGSPDDGTATDREVLWALARRVFRMNPIFGVGAGSFGAYAAETFQPGQTGGEYDENPARLWGRQLHSTYFQILCEYGAVGSILFLWLLFDFWRRNRDLRRPAFASVWTGGGGLLDLTYLSLGLEAAMIGFLTTAVFYNQIFDEPWLYTISTVNALLWIQSRPGRSRRHGRHSRG